MTTKQHEEESAASYARIPPSTPNYVVLPLYPRHHNQNLPRCLGLTAVLLVITTATFFLYPSDPELSLARLSLNRIQVRTSRHLSLDLSLSLTLRVRNRDFFSLKYSSLNVSIGYRGREMGFVTSNGGKIRARGSSYVNATLVLDGFEVVHDVVYLIGDLARGSIPFDTESEVKGTIGILFVDVPIMARTSCEVYVSTNNQTVIRQDCYSQGLL